MKRLPYLIAFLMLGCISKEQTKPMTTRPVHHTENGFQNPHDRSDRGFGDFLKWQFGRGPQEQSALDVAELGPYQPIFAKSDLGRIQNPSPASLQITWVGHATFLIQVDGVNILTDPIFSERCSPVSFMGPKRVGRPGLAFKSLPDIQAVVVSHNHYDHLDAETVEQLGNEPHYFVPLGLKEWFRDKGITNVTELDWWQKAAFSELNIHSAPVQHFSGRSLVDRNETLWTGWVIETNLGNVFFAGDTGYSPDFVEIGERFGPMKVALIPIGAYMPRWFMGPVHVDPPEAVQIHEDVRSEQSIGMHWGTFNLADEAMAEPPVYLKKALRQAGVGEEEFFVMKFGETRNF